jgi:hypothetical protein
MKTELHIKTQKAKLSEPRIGGISQLSKNIVLPQTTLEKEEVVKEKPSLLFSIPIKLLKNLKYEKEYRDYYCSVFFNCDLNNYEYISIMQDFYKDEYLATIVIIHKIENNNRDDACIKNPYLLNIINKDNEEIEWLQDKIAWDGYSYICEFETLEIDKLKLDINLTFDSAKGYLFIKDNWKENENCGAFLLQNS